LIAQAIKQKSAFFLQIDGKSAPPEFNAYYIVTVIKNRPIQSENTHCGKRNYSSTPYLLESQPKKAMRNNQHKLSLQKQLIFQHIQEIVTISARTSFGFDIGFKVASFKAASFQDCTRVQSILNILQFVFHVLQTPTDSQTHMQIRFSSKSRRCPLYRNCLF